MEAFPLISVGLVKTSYLLIENSSILAFIIQEIVIHTLNVEGSVTCTNCSLPEKLRRSIPSADWEFPFGL